MSSTGDRTPTEGATYRDCAEGGHEGPGAAFEARGAGDIGGRGQAREASSADERVGRALAEDKELFDGGGNPPCEGDYVGLGAAQLVVEALEQGRASDKGPLLVLQGNLRGKLRGDTFNRGRCERCATHPTQTAPLVAVFSPCRAAKRPLRRCSSLAALGGLNVSRTYVRSLSRAR